MANNEKDLLDLVLSEIGESRQQKFANGSKDEAESEQEGFFRPVQCPECLEELRYQLEQGSIPRDEITDPEITPETIEYPEPSFKQGADRYTRIVRYQCSDHTDVSIRGKETWYEDNL